jgi:hypothetical protein
MAEPETKTTPMNTAQMAADEMMKSHQVLEVTVSTDYVAAGGRQMQGLSLEGRKEPLSDTGKADEDKPATLRTAEQVAAQACRADPTLQDIKISFIGNNVDSDRVFNVYTGESVTLCAPPLVRAKGTDKGSAGLEH